MSSTQNQVKPYQEEEDPCLKALLFSSYHVFPVILHAAVELDLFGIIAQAGPGAYVSPAEVVAHLPAQTAESPEIIDRVLRCLASHSLLTYKSKTFDDGRTVERRYAISPVGKYYVKDEDGGSVGSLSLFAFHRATIDVWLQVKEAIVGGGGNLFQKVHGKSIFQYMKEDSSLSKYFNDAMADLSATQTRKILEVYHGFDGISTLVDVGGGKGATLNMIVSKYPSIKGINFDLPQVIGHAPSYPGVEHVGGDMFASVPEGDAIMIKGTCHNWSDESCIKFLKNCYKALPANGKVIVMDFIMPDEPEETMASKYVSMLDNAMLIQPGGKERTEKQFEYLCKGAGFTGFKVAARAVSALGVIEFNK
ncbi:isoliquiritigenin 2'-O-methyltransferase-like isoform X1 [Syzygium oleosum]|uniref:isoliquiritigenin 2'-O-methyltransferase-like isoform X1 n=1 Tax=Syzygium oleosum TaxID=219896 RepID=UPI0024BA0103|nr:isoliquiritigenin 2'-O-methyltransferase-like isoform X1 [Syzygium oleosum]